MQLALSLTKCWFWARQCAKCFINIISLNPSNNPLRQALLVPFYRWGNWDSRKLSNLPNKAHVVKSACKPRQSDVVHLVQVSITRKGTWLLFASKNRTSRIEGGQEIFVNWRGMCKGLQELLRYVTPGFLKVPQLFLIVFFPKVWQWPQMFRNQCDCSIGRGKRWFLPVL